MTCSCAPEVVECIPRPTVADLICGGECCGGAGGGFAAISPEVKAWYVAGAVAGAPDAGTAEEVVVLGLYERAIDAAVAALAGRVCMARFAAAPCSLRASVCVTTPCRCVCGSSPVCACDAATVDLREFGDQVTPDRVLAVSVDDGAVFGINAEAADASSYALSTHRSWRLRGPKVTDGGTMEVVLALKPARSDWMEAVGALACVLVPGAHTKDCGTDDGGAAKLLAKVQLSNIHKTGIDLVDSLDRSCGRRRVRRGRGTSITSMSWNTGLVVGVVNPPAGSGSYREEIQITSVGAGVPVTLTFATLISVADVTVTNSVGTEITVMTTIAGNQVTVESNQSLTNIQIRSEGPF